MHIPERILMGPGPSTVSQRVLRALGSPTLGHLDPRYIEIMDETCVKLRKVFQTQNQLTFPVSATGMAGMECVVTNLMEPGDMEEGLRAAHQIGDDTLMKAAGRRPVESMFTHGSAEQRMAWLKRGLQTGNPASCDTFSQDL